MSVSALDDKWPLRRLPPAGSPISLGDLARAAWRVARWSDVRTQFAVRLAEAYDAVSVELCASGTDALTRALSVAGALTGGARIVALPAYACYDLASAAVGSGSHVVFYDLDPHTLGPDLDSVRQTLSDGASAVVSAPLYGIPVEWQPLADLVTAAGAALVEDAAQGHGSTWRGRPLGSLGTLSVLSFGRGKGWTGGAGGALLRRRQVTQLPERSQRHAAPLPSSIALEFSVFIRAVFQWALGRPRLYPIPAAMPWLHLGETVYHEPLPPREMTAIAAALLDCTVLSADREDDHRRQVAHYYLERLPFGDNLRQVSLPL